MNYSRGDFDGSQIPGEWHRWLHCMTDDVPSAPKQKWQLPHMENVTGTKARCSRGAVDSRAHSLAVARVHCVQHDQA